MKLRSATAFAVLLYLLALAAAMKSEESNAGTYSGVYMSIGGTMISANTTVGEVGYRTKNNWDYSVTQLGEGMTKDGWQSIDYAFSISKIVEPEWYFFDKRIFMRAGASHVTGSPLVDKVNFRIGFGLDLGPVDLEYFHYSNGDMYETNTGIDGILLRYKFKIR